MNDENNIYSEYQNQNDNVNIINQVQNNINYVSNENNQNISKNNQIDRHPKGSILPALFLIFIIIVVSYFIFFYNKDISLFSNKKMQLIINESMVLGDVSDISVLYNQQEISFDNLIWSSSNQRVLDIKNGKAIALKKGTSRVTAEMTNGEKTSVLVEVNDREILLEKFVLKGKKKIYLGESFNFDIEFEPSNATNRDFEWQSGNINIIDIVDGKVTAKGIGTATVIAKSSNGKTASMKITVVNNNVDLKSIEIIGKTTMYVGGIYNLNVIYSPSNATNKKIEWTCDKNDVLSIDQNGKVKALKKGMATITAKSSNGKISNLNITVKETDVVLKSISLQGNNQIKVGERISLLVLFNPENVPNKSIEWSSEDSNIALVDDDGKVTGVNIGTTNIVAKSSNGKYAKFEINVTKQEITNITILGNESVKVGNSLQLNVSSNLGNVSNNDIKWTSSNPLVATVSNGKVIGVSEGTTTITATTSNGKSDSKVINVVNIVINVESISISGSNTVNKGSSITLTATVSPSNATNKIIEWTSSNPSVATVSNGKVTGVREGNATITATTSNGKVATKSITVVNPIVEVTSVSISGSNTVNKGSSITLTATVSPSNATNKTIEWTSSNPSVATVNNGKVTGVSAGTAMITATTSNGKVATKTISVKDIIKVSMKIGTFNVARFRQSTYAWSNMADMIKNNGLNIVGIQEGTAAEKISKYPSNFIKGFVDRTGLTNYVYLSNLDGNYINGNTIISKYEIQSSNNYLLTKCYESRALQKVVIKVNGINISFYNTHFSYQKSSTEAKSCPIIHLKSALSYMENDPNPAILTGDFNWDYSVINKYMDSKYTLYTTKCEPGRKCPSNRSGEDKMDLIYVKEKDSKGIKRIEKVNEEVVEASKYSDHNLIITTINVIN